MKELNIVFHLLVQMTHVEEFLKMIISLYLNIMTRLLIHVSVVLVPRQTEVNHTTNCMILQKVRVLGIVNIKIH